MSLLGLEFKERAIARFQSGLTSTTLQKHREDNIPPGKKNTLLRVIPTMTCWVAVVRWGLPPHNSFLLFRTSHLLRPTHQENTWQTYVKTAATAHAQTCQNMSGYDLSNIYEETEVKHVSRPPEARSKVFATATTHAQTCQSMSGYDLSNISKKQKSNMSVDLLKQGQKFLRQQRRMLKSQMHCSASLEAFSAPNMPNHGQDTTCQHISRINRRHQTCQ